MRRMVSLVLALALGCAVASTPSQREVEAHDPETEGRKVIAVAGFRSMPGSLAWVRSELHRRHRVVDLEGTAALPERVDMMIVARPQDLLPGAMASLERALEREVPTLLLLDVERRSGLVADLSRAKHLVARYGIDWPGAELAAQEPPPWGDLEAELVVGVAPPSAPVVLSDVAQVLMRRPTELAARGDDPRWRFEPLLVATTPVVRRQPRDLEEEEEIEEEEVELEEIVQPVETPHRVLGFSRLTAPQTVVLAACAWEAEAPGPRLCAVGDTSVFMPTVLLRARTLAQEESTLGFGNEVLLDRLVRHMMP